jgi:hypothetical protein
MKKLSVLLLWVSLVGAQSLPRQYAEHFNKLDRFGASNLISNSEAPDWLESNVPLLECPDKDIEEIYYFRWWTYRKHIRKTPADLIVTEFLPHVPWAGKYNSISCAAGHHIYEGRWLRNPEYLDDYSRFWFRGGGEPRRYSFWAADAIYARYLATGQKAVPVNLLEDLIGNYRQWEKSNLDSNGLFWQVDDRDGMEISIGGSGYRPTINSYMAADAVAIAKIARLAGRLDLAREYEERASRTRTLLNARLWDEQASFYKTIPRGRDRVVGVREEIGFVPWYFNLPPAGREAAWKQITDPRGFHAPFGPTTAERRHPRFRFAHQHECLWNGPSWPFATTQTLVAMANLLNNYKQDAVGKKDYFDLLKTYTRSHRLKQADGSSVPWIDEDLDPDTGEWIARRILHDRNDPNKDRGHDYNHSGYTDLIITGLAGLRPRADETIEVNPLLPEGTWDYFRISRIPYHGRMLTIQYDRSGGHYGKGAGLRVSSDGMLLASSPGLAGVTGTLPPARATGTGGGRP